MFQEYLFKNKFSDQDQQFQTDQKDQSQFLLKELNQIRNQTELIQKIFTKVQKQNESPLLALESIQSDFETPMKKSQSMISIFSLSRDLNNFSCTYQDKFKFGNQTSKCMREVKLKCSPQTHQYLAKFIEQNRKGIRHKNLRDKQNQKLEKLEQQNLMLKAEISKYQAQILNLSQKFKKVTKQSNIALNKKLFVQNLQKKLLKKQEVLIYQRKACLNLQKQVKKEINRLSQMSYRYEKIIQQNLAQTDSQNSCENQQQICCALSNSTIDSSQQKSQVNQLWQIFNKFQRLCQNLEH